MNTPPFFAVQKQTLNGETTLVAAQYTLDQVDIDPTTHFTLYVDTLTIPAKTFTLRGKNITIYSRKIICADGAILDTSGPDDTTFVLPYNPPKANNGSGQGDSGKPGGNGGATPETTAKDGMVAGNIIIKAGTITGKLNLKAVGGKGQQGQNGQDGGDGINGGPGKDAVINRVQHDRRHPDGWDVTQATAGGNGGNAGGGGNAGKSGNGGAGGTITVNTITALANDQVSHTNNGGTPGAAATPGKAGKIGNAGPGGRIAVQSTSHDHFHRVIWELSNNRQGGAQNGATASDGAAATGATKGNDGAYTAGSISDPSSMLAENTNMLSLLQLTMRYAEIEYLEAHLSNAKDYYQWVVALTSKETATTGLAAEFAGLNKQCRALIDQISQGLDYYANPMNYVPIVSLDYYQTSLDGMIATGNSIESVYNDYTAFLSNQTHNFTGMNNAISQAEEVIKTYKGIQDNLKTQILALPPVINQLSDALAAQYTVVMNANDAFKKAVEKAQGCSLASLLALLKTIVNVGTDVYAAFTAPSVKSVTTAIKDFVDVGISIENGKIIQDPNAIPSDPQSVANAWKSINPSGAGDVADDKKLIVLQADFDKTIKPYLSLPEAQEYQKQIHDYIGIAQARNAKLLDYTNACIQYVAIIGKIAQKQLEVDRIKAQIAQENVPGLISYRNFMYNLYQDFKSFVLKYLYQENRAFIYWSQSSSEFTIVDDSFIGLGKFHSSLKGKIIDQINMYSNPKQPITDLKIMLKPDGREKQFANLSTTRTFTFNIQTDDDHFLGWANILLTNFKIYINGATMADNGNLYVQFLHQGSVAVIDPQNVAHNYTHNQVLSVYQYTMNGGTPKDVAGGSLGGDGTGDNKKRIALSPYATFTINIPEKYNKGAKLDKIDSIEIHFAGYAVPSLKFKRRAVEEIAE